MIVIMAGRLSGQTLKLSLGFTVAVTLDQRDWRSFERVAGSRKVVTDKEKDATADAYLASAM